MKPARIVEVRPKRPQDGEFFATCAWIAIDSYSRLRPAKEPA